MGEPSGFAGLRVLVVEDEVMVSMLIEDMLTDLGCSEVRHAGSIERAYAALDAARPDAAMLDVNLAGRSSLPLAERLASAGIPFVLATGYGRGGIPAEWADRPVLQKPFTLAGLTHALHEALSAAPPSLS